MNLRCPKCRVWSQCKRDIYGVYKCPRCKDELPPPPDTLRPDDDFESDEAEEEPEMGSGETC